MLPPTPMLATKNITRCGMTVFLALAVFLTGCGPPGPRALLKGKSSWFAAIIQKRWRN